ncbi:DEHA2F24310p [Debaryomyces hansenii CBS767]|uniref:DEHA2F24310p n=1 Tax=Debaryomyces hansenii (strain ATCC 36239 / CBS 767 / BCRC 21394 / JCM 1990 / NBRC 0083 / IGC 2968) TaxID=284592 RepID=Q6BK73_DEBHA|nr:DEHA2F24310p [Debaryomyces hansenii CBS767]CAG89807.2 DEHA2F24310p [Debaryomyces hansenii CBS767]|eukprot:XP_461398.2 DEHA2F24310p [Debaryomyces hansenii CBS767]
MDEDTKCNELTVLYNEYKEYFSLCELKLNSSSPNTNTTPITGDDYYAKLASGRGKKNIESHIHLKTIEGVTIRVSVETSGWYEIPEDDTSELFKHYETFESLMMQRSRSFQNMFGNTLSNRLHNLISEKMHSEQA